MITVMPLTNISHDFSKLEFIIRECLNGGTKKLTITGTGDTPLVLYWSSYRCPHSSGQNVSQPLESGSVSHSHSIQLNSLSLEFHRADLSRDTLSTTMKQ